VNYKKQLHGEYGWTVTLSLRQVYLSGISLPTISFHLHIKNRLGLTRAQLRLTHLFDFQSISRRRTFQSCRQRSKLGAYCMSSSQTQFRQFLTKARRFHVSLTRSRLPEDNESSILASKLSFFETSQLRLGYSQRQTFQQPQKG
jgi:hypothetical protein